MSAATIPRLKGRGFRCPCSPPATRCFTRPTTAINLYPGLAHGAGKLIETLRNRRAEASEKYLGKGVLLRVGRQHVSHRSGRRKRPAHVATQAAKIDDKYYKISGQRYTSPAAIMTPSQHHPSGARAPRGRSRGIKGDFTLHRAEVQGEGRRFDRRVQRRGLRRYRAQKWESRDRPPASSASVTTVTASASSWGSPGQGIETCSI